jgi:transcriptional regulator with XRE-family HTH domain
MVNLEQVLAEMDPERRARIEARAEELNEEYLTLQELRKAHKMTQVNLAAALGVEQAHISRMEKRSDLLLSTLRSYVEAMGGTLRLVAEFPNHKAVIIPNISDVA